MTVGFPAPADRTPHTVAARIREESTLVPHVGLVLGSGLAGALGDALTVESTFAYTDLGLPPTGVPGHAGTLLLGDLAGVPVVAFSGRYHLYEGHDPEVPALLPRLAHVLGARTMVLTAAVGGLVPGVAAGTVVVLRDHINLMGAVPLRGWRYPDGMPAFVNAEAVYDPALRAARGGQRRRGGRPGDRGRVRRDAGTRVRDAGGSRDARSDGSHRGRHVRRAGIPSGACARPAGARYL